LFAGDIIEIAKVILMVAKMRMQCCGIKMVIFFVLSKPYEALAKLTNFGSFVFALTTP